MAIVYNFAVLWALSVFIMLMNRTTMKRIVDEMIEEMTRDKINKINIERLTRWKERLNERHSTPIMLIGVGHDSKEGQLMVLVTEERTDYEVYLLLREALRLAEEKISTQN